MTEHIKPQFTDEEIMNLSSLALAHVGDAVFELLIRRWVCKNSGFKLKDMHKATVGYVNAQAQAELVQKILPSLTDEEMAVYKRGRNAKVNSVPKNANISDYHSATGLEALMGYLYLKDRTMRIGELFDTMIQQ